LYGIVVLIVISVARFFGLTYLVLVLRHDLLTLDPVKKLR